CLRLILKLFLIPKEQKDEHHRCANQVVIEIALEETGPSQDLDERVHCLLRCWCRDSAHLRATVYERFQQGDWTSTITGPVPLLKQLVSLPLERRLSARSRWRVCEQAEQSFGRGRVGEDRVAQRGVGHAAEHRRLDDRHGLACFRA